jgi:hypothetical protein
MPGCKRPESDAPAAGADARQWNDIVGIIKQQGAALDVAYLTQWAHVLGVRDLLERVLVEAGLNQP